MVKLTAPLLSHFASGTLGSTIEFRSSPKRNYALQRRPNKKPIPLALLGNQTILRYAVTLFDLYTIHNEPAYSTYAATHKTSNRAAYLHYAFRAWRNRQMIPFDDPTITDPTPGDPLAISFDLSAPANTPNIYFDPWWPSDFWTMHLLQTSDEDPSYLNCYDGYSFNDTEQLAAIPRGYSNTFYIQALTWKISSNNPTPSNQLLVTL